MPDELNTPSHRWYQRRYNIALPNEDFSRDFIYASGISKIDAWIDLLAGRDYSVLGFEPLFVADFDSENYRVQGASTPVFSNAITHTRASTATYVDANGVLQTAASGVPRIGHHVYNGSAWVNEGLLHESEARTNLLLYSEVVDGTGWSDNASTSTNLTDGALGVWDGVSIASGGAAFNRLNADDDISVTSGDTLTFRVWVKAGTSGRIRINFRDVSTSSTSNILGNFGSITASSTAIGTITSIKEEDWGNGIVTVSGTITVNFTGNLEVGIGPDSAVSGETVIAYAAQVEKAPTPSSYIPTSGATATRAAETLTIPAANLPWPTPEVIGPELVDTANTAAAWVAQGSNTVSDTVDGVEITYVNNSVGALMPLTASGGLTSDLSSGSVYEVTLEAKVVGGLETATIDVWNGVSINDSKTLTNAFAEYRLFFVDQASGTPRLQFGLLGASEVVTIRNISVREINPLAVSIQMDGRVTYADVGGFATAVPWRWEFNTDNRININLDTDGALTGRFTVSQIEGGVIDFATGGQEITAGVFTPYSIASRHGSTFTQIAVTGLSGAANTTPVALADLSASNLSLGNNYNGTIRTFRVWADDITDAGLVEATEPSLVPSLSLTFDGTENSFIVEDWSE